MKHDILQVFHLAIGRVRGFILNAFWSKGFVSCGSNFKFYGAACFRVDQISVGDNCWFQAVTSYRGEQFSPEIAIGSNCKFSDSVHISGIKKILMGRDCLVGSNVYIGDHSHGSTKALTVATLSTPPSNRPLADSEEIIIGANVWICDGAVILAGTVIPDGCIVGANSVVKGSFPAYSVIGGVPARVIRKVSE